MQEKGLTCNNRYKVDNNGFATHQPVLEHILKEIGDKQVLELGCGEGSTELINHYATDVITVESDNNWMSKYTHMQTEKHKFVCIPEFNKWNDLYASIPDGIGLVFVDQGDWNSRTEAIRALIDKTDYVILHDSCYYPKTSVFGKVLDEQEHKICSSTYPKNCPPDCNTIKTKKRDYSDVFKYFKEYISIYGPPTLLGSNKIDVTQIDVNMD